MAPPALTHLAHVGLCVRDLAAAIEFYCDLLGCTINPFRPEFRFPGVWLHAGDRQIHLIERDQSIPGPAQHLALGVESVDAWKAYLDERNVPYRELTPLPGTGRQVFLADPSGNAIELNEPESNTSDHGR
jgi:glyoxylase I family protein